MLAIAANRLKSTHWGLALMLRCLPLRALAHGCAADSQFFKER
jgi:hypothetical protein